MRMSGMPGSSKGRDGEASNENQEPVRWSEACSRAEQDSAPTLAGTEFSKTGPEGRPGVGLQGRFRKRQAHANRRGGILFRPRRLGCTGCQVSSRDGTSEASNENRETMRWSTCSAGGTDSRPYLGRNRISKPDPEGRRAWGFQGVSGRNRLTPIVGAESCSARVDSEVRERGVPPRTGTAKRR